MNYYILLLHELLHVLLHILLHILQHVFIRTGTWTTSFKLRLPTRDVFRTRIGSSRDAADGSRLLPDWQREVNGTRGPVVSNYAVRSEKGWLR